MALTLGLQGREQLRVGVRVRVFSVYLPPLRWVRGFSVYLPPLKFRRSRSGFGLQGREIEC